MNVTSEIISKREIELYLFSKLPENVKYFGNLKFDQSKLEQAPAEDIENLRSLLKLQNDNELFVAGSTHSGEEKILLEVYQNLNRQFSNLKLLLAPRHPERTPQIEKLITGYGFKPIRISQLLLNTIHQSK